MKARPISLLVFLFFCFSSSRLCGQTTIWGNVYTLNSDPVPFANVLLLQAADSSFVKGTVTSEKGGWEFDVQPGEWIINARMIGYNPVYSEIIHLEDGQKNISVDDIIMKENVQELGEIVIKGQKPLLEKKPDRMIVNVENSIVSTGNTVLEILEKSPGVMVNRQSNSLSMNGKSGVTIMIDGKVTNMPAEAIVQMLNGMSSANIKEIELITSPPARYDAEGNGGMINIVLKENAESGTNGNIGLTAGYHRGKILAGNFNINQRKKRFNWFLDYTINSDDNINSWHYYREVNFQDYHQVIDNYTNRDYVETVQNLRAGLEIDLNRNTSVSLLVTGYRRNWEMEVEGNDEYKADQDSTIFTSMDIYELNLWESATGSFGIQHQFNQNQKLNLSFDYLYYFNDNPSTYDTETTYSNTDLSQHEFLRINKSTPINFKVMTLDYSNEMNQDIVLDIGAKTSISRFDNTVAARLSQGDETVSVDKFASKATLDEKIMAGYASANWKWNKKWSINGGLRYEYTDTYLTTPEQDGFVDRNYGNFFPSFDINHTIKDETSIHFSYSRRITRPTYNDMAPFAFLIGPNTYFSGNPALLPAIADAMELGYSVKQWWATLQFSYAKDAIANYQPTVNHETNDLYFRSENLEFMKTYGIQTGFPLHFTTWWEMQNFISYNYHEFRTTHYDHNPLRTIGIFSFNIANTFQFPKGFSMELSGYYQSNAVWGVLEIKPLGAVNFGLRKELKNNFGTISLSVNDIFFTSNYQFYMDVPEDGFYSYLKNDIGVRSVKLTYTLPFGNKKLNTVNIKSGAEEERKRVN